MGESPALVAGLDNVAVMGETIEQGRGHLRIAEHGGPFPKGEVRRDRNRGDLIELADEMKQQLSAGLGEGEVSELIEDDQIAPAQLVGGAPLVAGPGFGIEVIDQIDDVVAAGPGAVADASAGEGSRTLGGVRASPMTAMKLTRTFPDRRLRSPCPDRCICPPGPWPPDGPESVLAVGGRRIGRRRCVPVRSALA